ncbi:cysteine proteinase, partial [Ascoidea rubescens DSM 1968]
PFGDGSKKIFGMENFGNTCYCNSVLQCLYYSKEFRENILSFPQSYYQEKTDRRRKITTIGSKPHPFVLAAQKQLNANESSLDNNPIINGNLKSNSNNASAYADTSEYDKNEDKDKDKQNDPSPQSTNNEHQINGNVNNNNNTTNNNNTNSNSNNSDDFYANFNMLKQSSPFNLTIIGNTGDPSSTTEQRKRKAMLTGPILNIDRSYSSSYQMSNSMFSALKDIFECMVENESKKGVVSPSFIIEVLKKENELFRSSMHQDAHEFLNFLLNEVFEGLLTSETKCLTCEKVSSRDEKFIDLSIDLEKDTSITSCLKQFSASEILTEDNKFYCDNCCSLQEATKRIILKKLPKILSLHLKRFKYNEQLQRNVKLFHRVSFPLHLRLFNTSKDTYNQDRLYELYGVVVHIGGGPYHGHYISLIKTEHFGWLLFDDETVEQIDENFVLRFFGDGPGLAAAYVLFYHEISEEDYYKQTLY